MITNLQVTRFWATINAQQPPEALQVIFPQAVQAVEAVEAVEAASRLVGGALPPSAGLL
jgi:hypothetical protein